MTAPPDPGATAWRTEQAKRMAVIVDADDYFRAARSAMLKARHSIRLIGWDFDARVKLGSSPEAPDAPEAVGEFVLWLVRRNPRLTVHLLRWDMGALKSLFRGTTFFTVLRWMAHRRISTKLDGHHPAAASHHQKIVIVDDCVAFCGGIDMTGDRWDTRQHLDDEPRRVQPGGRPYKPWHDATCCVEGPVAAALGELFRYRWQRATGRPLAASARGDDCWPEGLPVDFTDVPVAISRTEPALPDQAEVREIEATTLALIAGAERLLYIESQYFASRKVAEAIALRLAEPDGPEIVLVHPLTAQGWLEPVAMDSARARLVRWLKEIDTRERLRLYHPYTAAGEPIYVHAKIMVVDERIIRVGSSNLNNRSMGLDTECDLAVSAPEASTRIRAIRDGLIAEHLGVAPELVTARIDETGSLIATIESFRCDGRSLRPYELPEISTAAAWLADREVLDPEAPGEIFEDLDRPRLTQRLKRWAGRRRSGGSGG